MLFPPFSNKVAESYQVLKSYQLNYSEHCQYLILHKADQVLGDIIRRSFHDNKYLETIIYDPINMFRAKIFKYSRMTMGPKHS
jgi:hypothetical protein